VGATNKIDKLTLKSERWYTADPIFWRPDPRGPYQRFTADDRSALEQRFRDHGRAVDRA
jgi:hypothetical protein